MLLGRLLHCDGLCIVFGSLSLLGLIIAFHALVMYLARPIVFRFALGGLLTKSRDSFDGLNFGILLAR